jgi:glucokinase
VTPRAALGIDVGGTSAKLVLLEAPGRILAETSVVGTGAMPARALTRALAREARVLAGGTPARVEGVGVGIAGLVDPDEGLLHSSPNLPRLRNYRLARDLARAVRLPVRVENDANVCLLAETRIGAAAHHRNVVLLTLGTGVGGAFLVDGRLYRGAHGFAGEPGHTVLDPAGPRCACGGRGCVEAFLGSGAILRRARAEGVRARGVHALGDLAAAGDPGARRAIRKTGELLGRALSNFAILLDPDGFVVAGGVAQLGRPLFRSAEASLARALAFGPSRRYPVVPALFGARAGAVGAALLFLDPPARRPSPRA